MAAGSLILHVAGGFILRRCTTECPDEYSIHEVAVLAAYILRNQFIGQ
jgi:hypothetical protein